MAGKENIDFTIWSGHRDALAASRWSPWGAGTASPGLCDLGGAGSVVVCWVLMVFATNPLLARLQSRFSDENRG